MLPKRLARRLALTNRLREDNRAEAEEEGYGPLDRLVRELYLWLLWVAPSWLLTEEVEPDPQRSEEGDKARRAWENRRLAWYVAFWFVVLIAILWVGSPGAAFFAVPPIIRLVEIFTICLGFVLNQREPRLAGSLITVGVLGAQTVLIFAILNRSLVPYDFASDQCSGLPSCPHPASPLTYLFMSWTDMSTVGNGYEPASDGAKLLQMGATTAGVLLVGIIAARAITAIGQIRRDYAFRSVINEREVDWGAFLRGGNEFRLLIIDPIGWIGRQWPTVIDQARARAVTIDVLLPQPGSEGAEAVAERLGMRGDQFSDNVKLALEQIRSSWRRAKASATPPRPGSKIEIRWYDVVPAYGIFLVDNRCTLLLRAALSHDPTKGITALQFEGARTLPVTWARQQVTELLAAPPAETMT